MRCGIPLLGDRVAPRCRCADGILVVLLTRNGVRRQQWLPLEITNPLDLISVLKRHRIDTVVCGGISREERETLTSYAPTVIENVACSAGEALAALEDGSLRPGFGFESGHTPGKENRWRTPFGSQSGNGLRTRRCRPNPRCRSGPEGESLASGETAGRDLWGGPSRAFRQRRRR